MVQFDFPEGERTILLRAHYDQKDRCAAVPGGRWVPKERAWEYIFTPTTASCLLQSFSNQMNDEDRQKLQSIATRLSIAQSVKNGQYVLASPVSNTAPWHHQVVCYNMTRELLGLDEKDTCGGGVMLALDMGPQPLNAKILTPNGWVTMEQIKINDYVIGSNGKPTRVTHITPNGVDDVYEVTFSDKAKTQCTKNHLWSIISPRDKWQNKKYRSFSLEKILSFGLRNTGQKNNYWRWFIPMVKPVEFSQNNMTLPIDPYLLGLLIGDGGLTRYTPVLTTIDNEIIDEIKNILPKNVTIKKYSSKYGYGLSSPKGQKNELLSSIKKLKLNVRSELKHIPKEYLFSTIENRIALLQGLLDTDGYARKTCGVEFCTSSKQLSDDFQQLVRSLGGTATTSVKKTKCLDAYRSYVKLPQNVRPFRLKRKLNAYNNHSYPTRSFRSIKHIGKMYTQCITVEAENGLYVTDDYIVTHNCGKSRCAVDLICNYPDKFKKVLIVCPVSVIDVWAGNNIISGQFDRHATEDQWHNMVIHPVKGVSVEKKTKAAEMARLLALNARKQFICVINYESAWREPFAKWAHDVGFDLIVLDESHRIKTPSGKASKFFASLAKTTKYRLALTGTPCPHSPLDIYGQYRFLDPGVFGTSFTKFRSNFAVMGGFQGHQVLSYRNTEILHDKMFLLAHRVMSKDVFDLPPFQSEIRTCTLSKDERDLYNQMNENFCVEIKNNMVTAANALVKLLRLQEITSGYLDKQHIGDSKRKLLADVLEDFDVKEPIIIFARFTNDLKVAKEIAESQGRTYGELSGNCNDLSQWQGGNKDVLGVQIKSGREGVDFTRARYSIYYSLGFSLGDYEQSIKRLDRPGQSRSGMYIHLLAEDTIDFKVMDALKKKQEIIESVLKQYYDEIPDFNIPEDITASI